MLEVYLPDIFQAKLHKHHRHLFLLDKQTVEEFIENNRILCNKIYQEIGNQYQATGKGKVNRMQMEKGILQYLEAELKFGESRSDYIVKLFYNCIVRAKLIPGYDFKNFVLKNQGKLYELKINFSDEHDCRGFSMIEIERQMDTAIHMFLHRNKHLI